MVLLFLTSFMQHNTKLTLKIYWEHAKKYKISLILILIFGIIAPILNTIVPIYFKKFFDTLVYNDIPDVLVSQLIHILVIIFVLNFIQWMCWRIVDFSNIYYQSAVMKDLAHRCFAYLHKHSFSYFNNNFSGSLIKKVNRFVRAFEGLGDRLVWNMLPLVVNLTSILIVLFYKNILLGGLLLIWIIIFLLFNWLFIRYKLPFDIKRSEKETRVTSVLADTVTNNVNVKLFNGYARELQLFDRVNDDLKKIQRFTWRLEATINASQHFFMMLLEFLIFYVAIMLWKKELLTVGDFVLIQSYILIVIMKIWDFGRVVRHLYKDLADAEEMTIVLNTEHEIIDTKSAKPLNVSKAEIVFEHVNFSYNKTRRIIEKMNMTIKPHQKVALVGPSGAGKSTIVKLLLRQHDLSSGKILIDGQKISHVTQESLWNAISLVPQDPILFHRTLMENIRYGKSDASDEEVIEAAKQAHCHEFISSFPEQYDTYVGERGVKLSGGERQRVAIARAILRNAPILILDEATSSLDSESEGMIQDALDTLMKGKTVIVIAHRLSTIMRMDRIIVIDEGGIIEDGNHTKLLKKKNGIYAKLWKLQAGGFIA